MIKKLKQVFSSDLVFYWCLILFIVIAGQLPIILHYFHTPAGYYYPLLDRTAFSDYYYLGLIRYAIGPEWLLKIPYVIYDHQASIIQIFYVFLGKLSLVTGIGPAEMFAIFRVLGGLLFAVSVVFLLKTILSKNQARLAFIFFLLAQPLPALDFFSRTGSDFDNWVWHFGEAARRISAMPPHYTFGKGLTILSLAFLILYLRNRKIKYGFWAGLLVFIAGIIYPPPVFIALFSLTTACVFYFAMRKRGMGEMRVIWGIILFLVGALLPLILLKFELSKGYPWDMWNKVELGWNSAAMQFEWGYIRMLGILVFFVAVVFLLRLGRGVSQLGRLRIFIFIWFFSSFLLFPFANLLQLGKFRFIEGAQIVPLSILSVWGWQYLAKNKIKTAFLAIFVANFLVFAALQVRWSTLRLWPLWQNVYFRPQERETLSFLEKNAPNGSIVVVDTFSANFLPAFARVRTTLGFPDFYPNPRQFKDDELTVVDILKGKLPEEKVKEYLSKKQADFLYYDASVYGEKTLYPQFLQSVYQNSPFTIYKVVK